MTERGGTLQRSQYSVQQFPQGGTIWLKKKENEKSFYSLILLEQRFPLKIFLAKYVRILVKSVQLGYSSGNLSDPLRIYQRIGNRHMIPRNCFILHLQMSVDGQSKNM